MLAEAGYPDGITLEIANGDTEGPWMTDACAIFKNQAAPAGIDININKMPANQYWELWDKAPWGYTAWTHRPLGTMVLGLAYRAGVPWNECAYNNPAFDAALDDAEGTLDVEERRTKMAVCQQIIQDDAIVPAALLALGLQGVEQAGQRPPDPSDAVSSVPQRVVGRRVSNEAAREAPGSRAAFFAAGSCARVGTV